MVTRGKALADILKNSEKLNTPQPKRVFEVSTPATCASSNMGSTGSTYSKTKSYTG